MATARSSSRLPFSRRRCLAVSALGAVLAGLFAAGPPAAVAGEPVVVARWSFEETSGSVVVDDVGTLDGVLAGAIRIVDGHAGHAIRFASPSGRVVIPDDPMLRAAPMTISAWLRGTPGDHPVDGAVILEKGARACDGGAYALIVDQDWVALRFRDGLGQLRTLAPHPDLRELIPAVWDGAWHHIAIQAYAGSVDYVAVYLDGRIVAMTYEVSTVIDHGGLDTSSLSIGGSAGTGCPDRAFSGDIDELVVYDGYVSRETLAAMEAPVPTTISVGEIGSLGVDRVAAVSTTIQPSPIGGWLRVTFEDDHGVEHPINASPMYDGFVNPSTRLLELTPEVGGSGVLHFRYDAIPPQLDSEISVPASIERWVPSVSLNQGPVEVMEDSSFAIGVRVSGSRSNAEGLVDLVELVGTDEIHIGSASLTSYPGGWEGYAVFDVPAHPAGSYAFRADYHGSNRNQPGSSMDTEIVVRPTLVPGEVVINGGAAVTDSPIVTVDIPAVGATGVQINRIPDPATIAETYSPQKQVWLTAPWYGDDSDGLRTIYVRWVGYANVWSAWKTATITLARPESAKSIQIDGGAPITGDRAVDVSVPVPVGADVTHVRISNDGQSWSIAPHEPALPWTLAAGDGLKRVWGSWQDSKGRWTTPISGSIVLDTTAPAVSTVAHRFGTGQAVVGKAVPVTVSWTGSDTGSGIDRFELQQQTDLGEWTAVSASLRRASLTRLLPSGHAYRFRVRAVDHAGHVGSWRTGVPFRLSSHQETSSRIRYTGTWRTGSSTSYWGAQTRYSMWRGSAATITVTGRGFAWIGSRGPSRGTARIYVNGVLQATVNSWASTSQHKQVLYQQRWSTDATRSIRVVILGTQGHPRVDLDAIVVLR